MHHKIVDKIYFFQDKDPGFISAVIPKLRNLRLNAGEFLYKEHDYTEEMYFLTKGRVNLLASNGVIFKSYVQGSYFGEGEILEGKNRDCTLQVTEPGAKFMLISKHDLLQLLEQFPKIAEEMQETARLRSIKNQEAKKSALSGGLPTITINVESPVTGSQTTQYITTSDISPKNELLYPEFHQNKKKKKSLLKKEQHRRIWKGLIEQKKDKLSTGNTSKWNFLVHKIFKPQAPGRRKSQFVEPDLSINPTGSKVGLVEKALKIHPNPNSKWNVIRNNREKFRNLVVAFTKEDVAEFQRKLSCQESLRYITASHIGWFTDEADINSPNLSDDENDCEKELVLLKTVLNHLSKHELRIKHKVILTQMSLAKLSFDSIEENYNKMKQELTNLKEYLN